MRRPGARGQDYVIRLNTVSELFAVDSGSFLETGRIDRGMDEIFYDVLAQKRVGGVERVVIVLPAHARADDIGTRIGGSARRYCQLRAVESTRAAQVLWRQGFRSLWWGVFLFVVGVGLSYYLTEPYVTRFWDQLLGNGLFLVVAWVGLWYPLDLICFSRQPLQREARTWRAMESMAWTVQFEAGP